MGSYMQDFLIQCIERHGDIMIWLPILQQRRYSLLFIFFAASVKPPTLPGI